MTRIRSDSELHPATPEIEFARLRNQPNDPGYAGRVAVVLVGVARPFGGRP